MEAKHTKVKKKNKRLRQEMQELWIGFVVQKEELEGEYQKQVDDMFFFGYQCYMKKHGIMQDIHSYPSDDEVEVVGGPTRGDGEAAKVGPSGGQA